MKCGVSSPLLAGASLATSSLVVPGGERDGGASLGLPRDLCQLSLNTNSSAGSCRAKIRGCCGSSPSPRYCPGVPADVQVGGVFLLAPSSSKIPASGTRSLSSHVPRSPSLLKQKQELPCSWGQHSWEKHGGGKEGGQPAVDSTSAPHPCAGLGNRERQYWETSHLTAGSARLARARRQQGGQGAERVGWREGRAGWGKQECCGEASACPTL